VRGTEREAQRIILTCVLGQIAWEHGQGDVKYVGLGMHAAGVLGFARWFTIQRISGMRMLGTGLRHVRRCRRAEP